MTSQDLFFEQLKLGPMDNFHYVFGAQGGHESAVVDPGFEPRQLVKSARAGGREVTHIVLTHSHRDHVAALAAVRDETDAKIVAHPESPMDPDLLAEDGAELDIAGVDVTCHHTPGHAPDHVAYVVADSKLLVGDALFIGDCGRVDLPGADVEDMWHTLMDVIPSLEGHLEVCPGHDYGPQPTRLLSTELEENFTLEERELDEFKDFMGVE